MKLQFISSAGHRLLLIASLITLILSSVYVFADDPLPNTPLDQNLPVDQNQPIQDPWQNPQYVQQHFEENPAKAFESNPEQAWQALEKNPDLMGTNPKVLDAAFNQDPLKASTVINNKVDLLKDPKVLERYDQEAIKNVALLNNNPDAKNHWFWQKYGIYDKHATVSSYTGSSMTIVPSKSMLEKLKFDLKEAQKSDSTTYGKIPELRSELRRLEGKSTTFNPSEFRSAKVLEDGSIQVEDNNFLGATKLSQQTNDKGLTVVNVEGGVIIRKENSKEGLLNIKQGELKIETSTGTIRYNGDFSYNKIGGVDIIKSSCVDKCSNDQLVLRTIKEGKLSSSLGFYGQIQQKPGFRSDQFIIKGGSELVYGKIESGVMKSDGSRLKFTSNSDVYYTEEKSANADNFCTKNSGYSCVVNTPGENRDGKYWSQLKFKNIQHKDIIQFQSGHYYNKVRAENMIDGKVSYTSLRESKPGNYVAVNTIIIDKTSGMKGSGDLAKINAGRIDYGFMKDGKEMLQHISSNQFMLEKVPPTAPGGSILEGNSLFFDGRKQKIVTCSVNDDCEEKLASSFGKVILPQDGSKKITTTIIVAGDHAELAKSALQWCRKDGCYIINSRDVPPVTNSVRLIISGHHLGDTDYIWRDAPDANAEIGHNPIDTLSFKDLPKEKEKGRIKEIAFSACNTVRAPMDLKEGTLQPEKAGLAGDFVKAPVYDGFSVLYQNYPSVKRIVGQHGTAPYTEKINDLMGLDLGIISYKVEQKDCKTSECNIKGYKAQYVKLDSSIRDPQTKQWKNEQRWFWTGDGKICYDIIEPQKSMGCSTVTVAAK